MLHDFSTERLTSCSSVSVQKTFVSLDWQATQDGDSSLTFIVDNSNIQLKNEGHLACQTRKIYIFF
jgi:peroxiredoxin